jgi:hypothetical protein
MTGPARTGPVARCPACDGPLDGGPVSYYCPVCQRGVMAADARTGGRRPLSAAERRSVIAVAAAIGVLGLIGFANSFARVAAAARPTFGALAPTVPLGIDLGVAAFSAIDIVLARLDMRPRWVRLIPWALTAVTVYLNVTGEPSWFARVAHGVFPLLWVAAVELGAYVVRRWTRLAEGTAMDRIRISRWLLAPARTAALWRRMILWEIRSYPDALARERARLLALTGLQDAYGPLAWRWKAPRRVRALYRLGELAPAPENAPDRGPDPDHEPVPDRGALSGPAGPDRATGTPDRPVPVRERATRPALPSPVPSPVSDRSGLEHARAAYRASVTAGAPLSGRALADRHGISRRQAARIIDTADGTPALSVVGRQP